MHRKERKQATTQRNHTHAVVSSTVVTIEDQGDEWHEEKTLKILTQVFLLRNQRWPLVVVEKVNLTPARQRSWDIVGRE
jgi:hypothetical protein